MKVHDMVRDADIGGYTCLACGQNVTFDMLHAYRFVQAPDTTNARERAAIILKEVAGDCGGTVH